MIRFALWVIVGAVIGAINLWASDSDWILSLLEFLLPGWLMMLFVFFMIGCMIIVYYKLRWTELAKGDLNNFLDGTVNNCLAASGLIFGLGVLAGTHWAFTQTGYGHGVFMISVIMSCSFAWLGYGMRDLRLFLLSPGMKKY